MSKKFDAARIPFQRLTQYLMYCVYKSPVKRMENENVQND